MRQEKQMISRVLLLIMVHLQLVASPAITQQRDPENADYNTNSGHPSDIPFNVYDAILEDGVRILVDATDLTQGSSKSLFLGYGIYDIDDKYCQYIPVGTMDQTTFNNQFENEVRVGNHSYFISRNAKTYNECSNLAGTFDAKVYTPQSESEAINIRNSYSEKSVWVGFYRESCMTPLLSVSGETPRYTEWNSGVDRCEYTSSGVTVDKFYVSQLSNGKLENSTPSESHYCVIEFDSPDYTRPQKVCSPWIRVERTFEHLNDPETMPFNLAKNFITVPAPVPVYWCKPPFEETAAALVAIQTQIVECTQYQSRSVSSECSLNMGMPSCFVDECSGIIKEKCRNPIEVTGYKDYIKGVVVDENGNRRIDKIKSDIKTFQYTCPVNFAYSSESCESRHMFKVYPVLCKDPLDANNTSWEIGTVRRPAYDDGTGNPILMDIDPKTIDELPIGFFTTCPLDGNQFLFSPVDSIKITTNECLEYEEVNTTVTTLSQCVQDRDYTEHTVNVYLNEDDIYENDGMCIRTNTVAGARPGATFEFDINLKNHSKLIVDAVEYTTSRNLFTFDNDRYYRDYVMKLLGYPTYLPGEPEEEPRVQDAQKVADFNEAEVEAAAENANVADGFDIALKTILSEAQSTNQSIIDSKVLYKQDAFYLYFGKIQKSICQSNVNTFSSQANGSLLMFEQASDFDTTVLDQYGIALDALPHQSELSIARETQEVTISTPEGNVTTTEYKNCPVDYTVDSNDESICVLDQYECVLKGDTGEATTLIRTQEDKVNQISYFDFGTTTKKTCVYLAMNMDADIDGFNAFGTLDSTAQCVVRIAENFKDDYAPVLGDSPLANGKYEIIDYIVDTPPDAEDMTTFQELEESVFSDTVGMKGAYEVIAIQEFTYGPHFGWYQSAKSKPYLNNEIAINGSQVGSIKDWPTAVEALKYHADLRQNLYKKRDGQFLVESNPGEYNGVAEVAVASTTMFLFPLNALTYVITAYLNGKTKYIASWLDWTLTKEIDATRISINGINNPYGYNSREVVDSGNGKYTAIYGSLSDYATGTFKENESAHNRKIRQELATKIDFLREIGARVDGIAWNPINKGRNPSYSYPDCEWYNVGCDKVNRYSSTQDTIIYKDTTTHYMDATNRLIIVVPYAGNYKVSAMNASGNILAEQEVTRESFVESVTAGILYRQVQLGQTMALAQGMPDGNTTEACRFLDTVEWGGGVSGIYYEEQGYMQNPGDTTNLYYPCQKSSNYYVENNSPNQILIRDDSLDHTITIPLKGKMPFANQIFLVSLGEKEIRDYRCFGDFAECLEEDFKKIEQ